MAYQKQTFKDNETVLKAEHLNHIEDGIVALENTMNDSKGVFIPNGAKVGQIIQVAKVDENGQPTEWKAVDMRSSDIEPADDDIPKVYFTGTLPTSKDDGDVEVMIRYISKTEDFTYPATLKVQGSSSASYPKKNFTLKMYEDDTYEKKVKYAFKNWGMLNKFVLKAHWIDCSHVRNVGTAKVWGKIVASRSDYDSLPEELRNAPNNGATDGFTCKVFANGVYQGLYEWIVPKDKLFGQDSDVATHSIVNSEWNNQATCAFATTTPTINGNWSEELQDSMSTDISTSFANFIKFVAGATDEEFVANAEKYFDVQSVIDYDIFARVFCIVDNLCRNQIFFTYDGVKWYEGAWDLDAILGLPPTTRGFFAYDTEFQSGYIAFLDHGVTNMLYKRVETLFMDRFKARYAELRASVLSADSIIEVYERLTDVITTYDGLLKEDYASTTGGGAFTGMPYTSANNIQQIRNFVAQRLPYMDEAVAAIRPETPCTGIVLSANTLTFTEAGTQTLIATATPEDTTDPISWTSDNTDVVVVTNGIVTTVGNGNATITATCGNYSATCTVSVSGMLPEFDPDAEVDYSLSPISDVTWLENQKYNVSTGELIAVTQEYCTPKLRLQNCMYTLSVSGGSYVSLFMWDENNNYIGYLETESSGSFGKFMANPRWYYAIKFYTTSAFNASNVNFMPVDNTTAAEQTTSITFDTGNITWNDNNAGTECDVTEVFTSAGFTSIDSINKTNGHHVFLDNFQITRAVIKNNAPVFGFIKYSNQYLLSVCDSKADYVSASGWTLVLN